MPPRHRYLITVALGWNLSGAAFSVSAPKLRKHDCRRARRTGCTMISNRRQFFVAAGALAAVAAGAEDMPLKNPSKAAVWTAAKEPAASAAETGLQSLVSGAASGAVVRITKQLVLHPIDTVKTRLQYSAGTRQLRQEVFRGLYDGVVPPIVVGTPAGAVFFAVKDFVQTVAKNNLDLPADVATVLAVGLGNVPYWAILTPSEVIKTRQQAGVGDPRAVAAAADVLRREGPAGLYTGYQSNLAYAVPADGIKFLVYENLKRSTLAGAGGGQLALDPAAAVLGGGWGAQGGGRRSGKLSPLESAALGAVASAIAQAVTTPLDVVRTRLMTQAARDPASGGKTLKVGTALAGMFSPQAKSNEAACSEPLAPDGSGGEKGSLGGREPPPFKYDGIVDAVQTIVREEGPGAMFAGIAPRMARAVVSGAIQFASYEFTKGLFPVGRKGGGA